MIDKPKTKAPIRPYRAFEMSLRFVISTGAMSKFEVLRYVREELNSSHYRYLTPEKLVIVHEFVLMRLCQYFATEVSNIDVYHKEQKEFDDRYEEDEGDEEDEEDDES